MAPSREKWVRRFIIPETTRHKKGFTIYKVTSMVFLKSSHEEISKVSVWKRYNDFRKLHSQLSVLYSQSRTKENFPSFPKRKFFDRFDAKVIEERRECALKFLEFIGRHSYLYSSDIFIKFFESSHGDYHLNDCSQSLSSDTSAEDDHVSYGNSLSNNDIPQSILQPKGIQSSITGLSNSKIETKQSYKTCDSKEQNLMQNDVKYKSEHGKISMTNNASNNLLIDDNTGKTIGKLEDGQLIHNKNNNCYKDKNCNVKNSGDSTILQTPNDDVSNDSTIQDLNFPLASHDGSDLPHSWPEASQYILIAAAHMSAACKHEDLTEYEEAFTQYKMGISSLRSGVESDSNKIRAEIIEEKISKYLQRAEKLYNRYLNCNISLINKPISELQYYKVLKIIESVMLVKDVRQNCLNIVKAIEKLPSSKENISNYILRGQIPYMVRLYACVETDSAVFLVLQYLSRGKLWDFITLHYSSKTNKNCDKTIAKHDSENISQCSDTIRKSEMKVEVDGSKLKENLKLESTNTKVQMEMHPIIREENCEECSDVSTTQLLEKAQILLQSVNATLKESNSVANRLYKSDRSIIEHNTSLLNLKNSLYQSTTCNEVAMDINTITLEIDSINQNITSKKLPENNAVTQHYLSHNNIVNINSPCSSIKSSLSNSYKNLNFERKVSTSSSADSLKTDNTHFATQCTDINKNGDMTRESKLNETVDIYNQTEINDYCTSSNQRIPYNTLLESTTISSLDTEQQLWTIPENVICLWAAEILIALEALHQQEVLIFDLKPDNILLDDSGNVQLTYIIPRHDIDLLKYKHPYSSPELCTFSPISPLTPATDIWSFGVILYELIVGNKFETLHPGTFRQHSMINIPNKLSQNAKSLLLNILKYEPTERMTIPEIKQHSFFKHVNWTDLVKTL